MHEAARAQAGVGAVPRAGGGPPGLPELHVTKLEAAGNDFLVALDPDPVARAASGRGPATWSAQAVQRLCDRRCGVGADGLIVGRLLAEGEPGTRGGPAISMALFNADGTRAEMSGNGIRCLVHAAVAAGLVPPGEVRVRTDAGVRVVDYRGPDGAPDGRGGELAASARVDMGPVEVREVLEGLLPRTHAYLAHVGNPHLVVLGDVDLGAVDLAALAPAAEARAGAPVNVEVVRVGSAAKTLEMRVFERGVGETAACGTGSCAAAAAARRAGLVGDHVVVVNPGGPLEVDLGASEGETVHLGGPVRTVAEVFVAAAFVAGGA